MFGSLMSAAWPVAFVIAVWLFRGKLTELLPLLIFKYKDLQLSFGLDKAEADAKRIPAAPEAELLPAPDAEEKSRLDTLANLAPRAAIMQARADVDKAVNDFAEAIGLARDKTPYSKTLSELRQNELIDKNTVQLLQELRQIGNAAAHNMSEPTERDARRYQELAYRLVRQFEIATGAANVPRPGPIPNGLP
jgi:Domain of unknown function (DUF4145)